FFLILPPPLTSPLFPYTTLFRSHSTAICFPSSSTVAGNVSTARFDQSWPSLVFRSKRCGPPAVFSKRTWVSAVFSERVSCAPDEDRKSTRLNSSHLVISYAVFCL